MTTEHTEPTTPIRDPNRPAPPQIGGDNSHLTGKPHQSPAARPELSERAKGVDFKWHEPYESKGQLPGSGNLAISGSSSVLATAYTHNSPIPVTKVVDDTMVKVESSSGRMVEMTAQQASEMGRLIRHEDGSFRDVTSDDVSAVEQAHAERAADIPVTVENVTIDIDANRNFFGHLEQSLVATGNSLQPLIAAVLAEEPSSAALYKAAEHAGVDAAEAARDLERILDTYTMKALAALVSFDVLPEDQVGDFADWINRPSNVSGRLSATMEMVYGGGLTTLTSLARSFTKEHARDQAKLNAGQQR